jgi:pimeloyl-ACP methyl ester carboxylesterase
MPFLDAIYDKVNTSATIFAHAHLGLSSFIGGDRSFPKTSSVTLPAQVQAHLEFLDELLAAYGPETTVLLVGHSIGSWFVQEMLKARATALHPRPRFGVFMLFPVISEVVSSPGGKRFSVRISLFLACVIPNATLPLVHVAFLPPTLAQCVRICLAALKIRSSVDSSPLRPFLAGKPTASLASPSTITRSDICGSDDGRR